VLRFLIEAVLLAPFLLQGLLLRPQVLDLESCSAFCFFRVSFSSACTLRMEVSTDICVLEPQLVLQARHEPSTTIMLFQRG
jgi:hypothetical protein